MGDVIASGSLDARDNVKLWDAATGRLIRTLAGHTDRVRSVAFGPDGEHPRLGRFRPDRPALGRGDRRAAGRPGRSRGRRAPGRILSRRPDPGLGEQRPDRPALGRPPRVDRRPCCRSRYQVASVAFSPDGLTLASADENGYITLWDVATRAPATGHQRRRRRGAQPWRSRPMAAPWPRRVPPATIRLWDPVTGQELLTLEGNLGQVNALAFSPDGTRSSRPITRASHGSIAGRPREAGEGLQGGVAVSRGAPARQRRLPALPGSCHHRGEAPAAHPQSASPGPASFRGGRATQRPGHSATRRRFGAR